MYWLIRAVQVTETNTSSRSLRHSSYTIIYQTKVLACDAQIKAILEQLKKTRPEPVKRLPAVKRKTTQPNTPAFDVREALQ